MPSLSQIVRDRELLREWGVLEVADRPPFRPRPEVPVTMQPMAAAEFDEILAAKHARDPRAPGEPEMPQDEPARDTSRSCPKCGKPYGLRNRCYDCWSKELKANGTLFGGKNGPRPSPAPEAAEVIRVKHPKPIPPAPKPGTAPVVAALPPEEEASPKMPAWEAGDGSPMGDILAARDKIHEDSVGKKPDPFRYADQSHPVIGNPPHLLDAPLAAPFRRTVKDFGPVTEDVLSALKGLQSQPFQLAPDYLTPIPRSPAMREVRAAARVVEALEGLDAPAVERVLAFARGAVEGSRPS